MSRPSKRQRSSRAGYPWATKIRRFSSDVKNEKTRSLSGSGQRVAGTGCVSASPKRELLIPGGPGSIGNLPVAIEPLLEAALGNDVHAGVREHLVARQLLWITRDGSRCVIEREEEPVDQAQGEDL